jgi:hypothetical protein
MITGRFGDTSGRPFVEGRLFLPRLGISGDVSSFAHLRRRGDAIDARTHAILTAAVAAPAGADQETIFCQHLFDGH